MPHSQSHSSAATSGLGRVAAGSAGRGVALRGGLRVGLIARLLMALVVILLALPTTLPATLIGAAANGMVAADPGTDDLPKHTALPGSGCERDSWDREPEPQPDDKDESLGQSSLAAAVVLSVPTLRHRMHKPRADSVCTEGRKAHTPRAPPA